MTSHDTIAAISSATGPAARMIVRLSGECSAAIAASFVTSVPPDHAGASSTNISIRNLTVPARIYRFKFPRSYTGEDLIEFHIPGNPLLARWLLEDLLRAGARLAEPGEFTARAYFNGRLDLTAAEGVAATIAAGNEQQLAAARRLLSGELARRLAPAIDAIANTLALLEVGIDFTDEDVTFISAAEVDARISEADALLRNLLTESVRFERLSHEPTVVLVGRPNAGKSTLLNALAGHERAVVSPVAGTTRDILSAEVALGRGIIRLIDVAGLDEAADQRSASSETHRQINQKMHEHALRALEEADIVALVRDVTDSLPPIALSRSADLQIATKTDLGACTDIPAGALGVSAKTGEGLAALRGRLDRRCFGDSSATPALALNARHVQAIEEARMALASAATHRDAGAEFVAIDLRTALDALGSITGRISPDDLLGRIFSSFCIGK